jgi:ABC-2 type transport system permease protein
MFSALAAEQYRAVAAMRWQMLRHGLRTRRGKFEAGARIFSTVFFSLIGLAAGVGLGFAAYAIVSEHSLRLLPVLFWPVFLLWQIAPIMAASFQEHVDMSGFLRFPMSFGSYMLVTLVFGAFDIPSILGWICVAGIWTGVAIAQPAAIPAATAAVLLFGFFNVLLTRAVFAWLDRWLAQRRTREILGVGFLFLLLAVQLVNPALHPYKGHAPAINGQLLLRVERVQSVLPPGLSASAVRLAVSGRAAQGILPLGELAVYGALAGMLLGVRLHAEYRGESLGEGAAAITAGPKAVRRAGQGRLRLLSGPLGAVIEKELRYVARSGMMLYSLAAPLVMILILGGGRQPSSPFASMGGYALPVGVAYSFLGLTRIIYNSLGGEGAGVQLYFLSPTPMRAVMLAKNLVQTGFFCVEMALVCAIIHFRYGMPDAAMIAVTFCWLLFALPMQLAIGNLLSLTMAYRMTFSRMSREEGAVGNGLTSVVAQVAIVGVGAAVFFPLARYGHAGLASGVFLLLALAAAGFWAWILSRIDRLAAARREALIGILARAA